MTSSSAAFPAIPPAAPLPVGFVIRLRHDVRVQDDGGALIGGSPTRVLYLAPLATSMMAGRNLLVSGANSQALAQRLLDAGMADPVLAELPDLAEAAVTFVVPVRDRPEALDRLLTSIGAGRKVIVVDDGSLHPDAVAAVAAAHSARLVTLSVNQGPAEARNAGLRQVGTPFVAFVDSDMVIDPGVLTLLLRHFGDPRVALVAPRIMGLAGRGNWIARYEDARSSLDMGRHPASVRPLSPVSWLPAACLVARIDAIGDGFAPGLRVAEDVDLVWRLVDAGWRVRYEPAVLARHEHRARLADWMARKAYYGTGAHLLATRHPRSIAPAVLAPWSVGMLVAVLAQRRWSGPVVVVLAAITVGRIASRLGRSTHPIRVSARLTADGMVSALFQGSALLLRHWWPATVIGCLFSKRVRRATLAAAIADVAMEYARTDARLDPLRFGLLRRLDDLAYGGGVWLGAIRGRSAAALLPRIRGRRIR